MKKTVLAIDTAQAKAKLGLFVDGQQKAEAEWEAGRELAATFYDQLELLLLDSAASLDKLDGIIVVIGPGSFTGLRIGVVIVNALSYALSIPTAGVVKDGNQDLREIYSLGVNNLRKNQILTPHYGKEPNITVRKRSLPDK